MGLWGGSRNPPLSIGRSGRYGRKGVALNFVTTAEYELLKEIEGHYATEIEEMPEDISSLMK